MSSAADELEAEGEEFLYAYQAGLNLYAQPTIIPLATPAAGADWTTTIPGTLGVWIPLTITAKLTTSAVVANRQARVGFTLNGNEYGRVLLGANQAATAVNTYSALRGGVVLNPGAPSGQSSSLPMMPLLPGSTIASTTVNLDAGDQWASVVLYMLEVRQRDVTDLAAIVERIRAGRPRFDPWPGVLLAL